MIEAKDGIGMNGRIAGDKALTHFERLDTKFAVAHVAPRY